MFKFINEELFNSNREECEAKNGNTYVKELVSTLANDDKRTKKLFMVTANNQEQMDSEVNGAVIQTVYKENSFGTKYENVYVKIKDEFNDTDKVKDVIAVAFPFNGIFEPLEKSDKYSIYKGTCLSIKDQKNAIAFDNNYYRKICYFLIGIEKDQIRFLKEIELAFSAYHYKKDEDGNKQTMKQTLKVTIEYNEEENEYKTSQVMTEEAVEDVDSESFKGKPMFVTASKPKKDSKSVQGKKGTRTYGNKPQNNNGQKQDHFENMMKAYQNQVADNSKEINKKNRNNRKGNKGRR